MAHRSIPALLVVTLLLASCGETWYADDDGDGYGDAASTIITHYQPDGYVADNTDCDDADTSANPGETEVCNDIDDDCDGTIDVDVTMTWYADLDDDSYGDDESTLTVTDCAVPASYVANAHDCDDNDASVNPDATEVCNEPIPIDEDCNPGTTVDFIALYMDTDGDGYGDPRQERPGCEESEGLVADNTDCDDTDSDINPGAEEITYDGVDPDYIPTDENCDGEAH